MADYDYAAYYALRRFDGEIATEEWLRECERRVEAGEAPSTSEAYREMKQEYTRWQVQQYHVGQPVMWLYRKGTKLPTYKSIPATVVRLFKARIRISFTDRFGALSERSVPVASLYPLQETNHAPDEQ
jgi:hypothetical protein